MSWYCNHLLPRLLDWTMQRAPFATERERLLNNVRGRVLEIGFGSGINLQYYSRQVSHLHAIDPSIGALNLAEKRLSQASFPVECLPLFAEELPFEEESFDYVVSTWSLCTITDPIKSLQEVRRVLKKGGRFVFVEHGLSQSRRISKWQNRITPLHRCLTGGCHLNRNIAAMIEAVDFEHRQIEYFEMPFFRLVSPSYRGVAVK